MKLKLFITISFLILLKFLTVSCDNTQNVHESKKENISETEKIKSEKLELNKTADNLSQNIQKLKEQKRVLTNDSLIIHNNIYSSIRNSFLDHIIIGTKNLKDISELFRKIGFTIKEGKLHKNGIKNNFIEFDDNSEIEFVEIKNPTDNFTKEYEKLILQKNYGLQFALRVNDIENLKNNFTSANSNFTELQKGKDFSTLSAKNINYDLPIFFIEFNKLNNSKTNHENKTKGISSIWFETKNIKKTAHELVDIGFEPIGNHSIPTFPGKIVELKNANFKIILIESVKDEITGITISIENINAIKNILNNNFDKTFSSKIIEKGKSIFLPKEITKSIWMEFIEIK
ncbi:MAG: VOC family protein [Ignavibacteriae bacterium]|nr:VOC family protein [Ignavibacteriota bacterium]